jgi:recombination protein RecA
MAAKKRPASSSPTDPTDIKAALYAELDKEVGLGLGRALLDQPMDPLVRVGSGVLAFDVATGGGVPFRRLTELLGPPGGGKSTMALKLLGRIQREVGPCAWIDAEHQFDPEWAATNGVNVPDLYTAQPDTGEQVIKLILAYAKHGVKGIVLDSVPAVRTAAERAGDVEDRFIGRMPEMWSRLLPRIQEVADKQNVALIFINQMRAKIGAGPHGPTEDTPGGWALKHAYTLRVKIQAGQAVKDGEREIGRTTWFRVIKNRGPVRTLTAPFYGEVGFDPAVEVLDLAIQFGWVEQKGAWFSYQEEKMGQGKIAASTWLRERPDLLLQLHGAAYTEWTDRLSLKRD